MNAAISILALFLAVSVAEAVPAPRISVVARVETTAPYMSQMQLVKDPSGQPVLVMLQEISGSKTALDLVALDAKGKRIAEMNVIRPSAGKNLFIREVSYNSQGQLIVITLLGDQNSGDGTLYSDNLSTGRGVRLIDVGNFASVGNRIRHQNRNLVVVQSGLGSGTNGTYPTIVRVIDEDTGALVQQKIVDHGMTPKLGVDSQGNAKVLLLGYELFAVMDVNTGDIKELLKPRRQPSGYPAEVKLVTGEFISLRLENELVLLSEQDLLDGNFQPKATFAPGVVFMGGEPATLAVVEKTPNNVLITDLRTGAPLGPVLAGGSLIEIIDNQVAVLKRPFNPSSFVQGAILTYVVVATGDVLRVETNKQDDIQVDLKKLSDGRTVAVERIAYTSTRDGFKVVDVAANKVLTAVSTQLVGRPFKSSLDRLVGLRTNAQKQVCVIDLLDLTAESCVQNPLVHAAVTFGYQPFETATASVRLPLLGKQAGFNFPSLGFIDLRID